MRTEAGVVLDIKNKIERMIFCIEERKYRKKCYICESRENVLVDRMRVIDHEIFFYKFESPICRKCCNELINSLEKEYNKDFSNELILRNNY